MLSSLEKPRASARRYLTCSLTTPRSSRVMPLLDTTLAARGSGLCHADILFRVGLPPCRRFGGAYPVPDSAALPPDRVPPSERSAVSEANAGTVYAAGSIILRGIE